MHLHRDQTDGQPLSLMCESIEASAMPSTETEDDRSPSHSHVRTFHDSVTILSTTCEP